MTERRGPTFRFSPNKYTRLWSRHSLTPDQLAQIVEQYPDHDVLVVAIDNTTTPPTPLVIAQEHTQ